MSSNRALSFDILHLGRIQVHLAPAEQGRQAQLYGSECEQTRGTVRRKLHQHVDVAVGPEVVPQRRAEDGQLGDPVGSAERCQLLAIDRNLSIDRSVTIL